MRPQKRKITLILLFGRLLSQGNQAGIQNGDKDGQVGILSARPWLIMFLGTQLTFMLEAKICASLTMIMKSLNPKRFTTTIM